MTVTYRFNLPDEADEFEKFKQAPELDAVIYDFTAWLRSETKYATEVTSDVALAERSRIYEEWWRLLSEHNINPYT